jgi:hypothetical protein
MFWLILQLNETDAGFYQAASYAIDLATQNIDVHKGKQIPLLLCGNEKWCHGSLTVHGNVIVNDECKMQSDTINDMVAVTKLFEKRVKELRKYVSNNKECFDSDNYAVGELYIDSTVSIFQSLFSLVCFLIENMFLFII